MQVDEARQYHLSAQVNDFCSVSGNTRNIVCSTDSQKFTVFDSKRVGPRLVFVYCVDLAVGIDNIRNGTGKIYTPKFQSSPRTNDRSGFASA